VSDKDQHRSKSRFGIIADKCTSHIQLSLSKIRIPDCQG